MYCGQCVARLPSRCTIALLHLDSVDRNSLRSVCRERDAGSVQLCPIGSTAVGTAIMLTFRKPSLADMNGGLRS